MKENRLFYKILTGVLQKEDRILAFQEKIRYYLSVFYFLHFFL